MHQRWHDATHGNRVWSNAALLSCSSTSHWKHACTELWTVHTGGISGHESIVFLPVLPVGAHKGAWAQRMGQGPLMSTTAGIKNCGRDYFKCQHNVTSCVRRSNVQTVLSGEQLIDQVQFALLWLLRSLARQNKLFWKKIIQRYDFATSVCAYAHEFRVAQAKACNLQSNDPVSSDVIRILVCQRGAVLIKEEDQQHQLCCSH